MIMNKRLILSAAVLALVAACGGNEPQTPVEADAPVLLSTDPESGLTGVEGSSLTVKFSYDQKVKCPEETQGRITIDGAYVSSISTPGNDLVVVVDGLNEGNSYTLTLPEGTVKGFKEHQKLPAAISFSFSTKEPEPVAPLVPGVDCDSEGWEYASNAVKMMGPGWNLGNTLDSNSGDVSHMWIEAWRDRTVAAYETAWGQPQATRELIHMFKQAGFNSIRVPVTWYPHIGSLTVNIVDGEPVWDTESWTGYDVDPVWMARVKEVVNYVIDEGMYCILNVHHDTGDASTAWLRADPAMYEKHSERFVSLWNQIATEFAAYDNHLLFESFNEMLDAKGTWNYSTADAHETINKWNADFVATVRATGGNNAHRNLVCNTYAASSDVKAFTPFRLPEDAADHHLMVEVHSYAPYMFAMYEGAGAKTVFDAACEKEVTSIVEGLNTHFVSKGIPCIIGEYGCTSGRGSVEMSKQAACYVSNATRYNIPCFYWMTLSDADDRSVPKWTMPGLKDTIIKAYRENKKK